MISATFVDHDEARLAIEELSDGLGVTVDAVAALADVDPPLADPVLVAAHVPDESERAARDVLVSHGAAVVSRVAEESGASPAEDPAVMPADAPLAIADHLPATDPIA
ncbi:MAG TPA: hypothetical protein VFI28_07065 [Candidatus Limnocylindrales bacterium]|nr:hypothetical protein [Candidatus Limnocylindrales bacterium]